MSPQEPLAETKMPSPRWIWFITGPTACGKTTIAKYLAEQLGFSFVEGDDYHPKFNRLKMSRNHPLTDADRAAWLRAIRAHTTHQPPSNGSDNPNHSPENLVVTCSALKRRYRDVLRKPQIPGGEKDNNSVAAAAATEAGVRVWFVFLHVPEDVLRERARERKGHFAKEGLVKSQVEAMEVPREGREEDVVLKKVTEIMGMGENGVGKEVIDKSLL
ncbi:hypothetical protein N0V88_007118 [Collariella sp. IMI 366227]|nr:hypothetical protein N0V88_007118 [Collariella sp. IMI 366227]